MQLVLYWKRVRGGEVGMFWLTHLSNTVRQKNATSAETNSLASLRWNMDGQIHTLKEGGDTRQH